MSENEYFLTTRLTRTTFVTLISDYNLNVKIMINFGWDHLKFQLFVEGEIF